MQVGALLKKGAAAAKAGQWDACVEALAAASRMDSSPTLLGDLGLCEEGAGQPAVAYQHLRKALESAPPALKDPWTRYNAALVRLGERVALVFVTAYPSHAIISLDGDDLGPVDGRMMAVAPGTHTFTARLDGYEEGRDTRTFQGGDRPRVHLQLTRTPPPAAPPVTVTVSTAAPFLTAAPAPVSPAEPASWYTPAESWRFAMVVATGASLLVTAVSGATAIGLEVDRASIQRGVGPIDCLVYQSADGPYTLAPEATCAALHERLVQHEDAVNFTIGALITTGVLAAATGIAVGLERQPLRPSIAPAIQQRGVIIGVSGAW